MIRIYHHWEKWECCRAGMYESTPPNGLTADKCREMYAEFLSDSGRFAMAMNRVLDEWPHSCDQFLSNQDINRIAWLGQASMCIETGVSSAFRGGFKLLSQRQQAQANALAESFLKKWINRGNHSKSAKVHIGLAQQGLFK